VEIADAETHRLLAYIAAISDQGTPLPIGLAEEYGRQAERGVIRDDAGTVAETFAFFAARLQRTFYGSARREGRIAHLERLGWAARETWDKEESIVLTRVGKAVLRHLNQREVSEEEAVAITVKADDPLSYARVMGRIAGHDEAMLVDAYIAVEPLVSLLQQTRVTRILTSRKGREREAAARIASLVTLLQRLDAGRPVELRATDGIHDRFIIARSGPVEMLGTSMGAIGRHVTVYTPLEEPAAGAVRQIHEDLWAGPKCFTRHRRCRQAKSVLTRARQQPHERLELKRMSTSSSSSGPPPWRDSAGEFTSGMG
jgi:hypothetical protein